MKERVLLWSYGCDLASCSCSLLDTWTPRQKAVSYHDKSCWSSSPRSVYMIPTWNDAFWVALTFNRRAWLFQSDPRPEAGFCWWLQRIHDPHAWGYCSWRDCWPKSCFVLLLWEHSPCRRLKRSSGKYFPAENDSPFGSSVIFIY